MDIKSMKQTQWHNIAHKISTNSGRLIREVFEEQKLNRG